MNLVRSQARVLDLELIKQKILAEEIRNYIKVTFEKEKFLTDPVYIDFYKQEITPFIYNLAKSNNNGWMYFNPFLQKRGHDVWFVDMDGDGFPERQPEQGLEYYKNKENKEWFFKPMETGKPLWTNPYQTTIFEGQDISWISYSIPIFIDDIFIGVTGHDYLFNDFREKFTQLSAYGSGYGVLINDTFDFLIHPLYAPLTNINELNSVEYRSVVDQCYRQLDGIIRYNIDGEKRKIVAFSRLANNWVLMMTADEREVFKDFYSQLRFSVAIIFIGVIVASFIIFKITKYMTKSLEEVSTLIHVTGKGDYNTPIPELFLTDQSEIGILSRSVEGLRVNLKKSFEDLKNYSAGLEQVVEERTIELRNSKKKLEESLNNLRDTQYNLVNTCKFEAIHRFLMEIAHRLNTPLGNANLAVSVVEEIGKKLKNENNQFSVYEINTAVDRLNEAVPLISSSIGNSSKIISSLQEIARDFEGSKLEDVILKSAIEGSYNDLCVQNGQAELVEINFTCTGTESINTYPLLIKDIFFRLFLFCLQFGAENISKRAVSIEILNSPGSFIVIFRDSFALQYTDLKDRIFEPFSAASFGNDIRGMDMYIVFNIINLGLKGDIEFLADEREGGFFKITLPETLGVERG